MHRSERGSYSSKFQQNKIVIVRSLSIYTYHADSRGLLVDIKYFHKGSSSCGPSVPQVLYRVPKKSKVFMVLRFSVSLVLYGAL